MWIVSQVGAREHYSIPRALHGMGLLQAMITDWWIPGNSKLRLFPIPNRLNDRYHAELQSSAVFSTWQSNVYNELRARLLRPPAWDTILQRNRAYQKAAISILNKIETTIPTDKQPVLFSYSYAAGRLFKWAKSRGWKTVLGQMDPGPEEERIVAAEHNRYSTFASSWKPAPESYWTSWREEIELSDHVIVNSCWSEECLRREGVPGTKLHVIPLTYTAGSSAHKIRKSPFTAEQPFRLLFLGQINLRKGVGRLLDAMRLLQNEPIELILAGPTEIDPQHWKDLSNVKWIGQLARSEVDPIYAASDTFILPTLSDGFALTQLEAIENGIPVIASKSCGEVVENGENGFVLPDVEPDTIARTIKLAALSPVKVSQSSDSFDLQQLGAALQRVVLPE